MSSPSPNLKEKFEELRTIRYRAITTGDCIACGTCVKYCPLKIRKIGSDNRAITININANCGGCSVCFKRCPQNAISLIKIKR
ncbi:MAG: 4Fe-4S dicluster domain-containing protein [Promethearchaeota archaeon]